MVKLKNVWSPGPNQLDIPKDVLDNWEKNVIVWDILTQADEIIVNCISASGDVIKTLWNPISS